MAQADYDHDDWLPGWDNDSDECDGCGKVDGCCPLCCGFTYSPGSEQCDWCDYSDECARHTRTVK